VLYAKPHDDLTHDDGMRLGELEGIVGEEGGYSAEADAGVLLDGLGIEAELHERKMSELQGGQKVRVLLAQALFGNPSALLLDEPTNNLDLDSVHWLKEYLSEYHGVLIVISHDRHFLNSVCTHTADIDYQTIIMYPSGYDDMVLAKTHIRQRMESYNAVREKKIAQLNEFIARFFRRHAIGASDFPEKRGRAPADLRAGEVQHPAPLYPLRHGAPLGAAAAGSEEAHQVLRRTESHPAFFSEHNAGRKDSVDRPQRRRQDHHAEIADPQRGRVYRPSGAAVPDRFRECRLGP